MYIKNILNSFDFWLRRRIKISRGNYSCLNEPKINLLDHLTPELKPLAQIKERDYVEKYNLSEFKENSTKLNYLENLYIIDLLERFLDIAGSAEEISVLDIGSKNWCYAVGEYKFFKYNSFKKNLLLNGIEIDPYRLYTNLYSRYDYAKYYIRNLNKAHYVTGDLLNHQGSYDYITWFLPFIAPKPLLNWGLPLKYFKPEKMLLKAYELLKPGGKLLIVNQGEEEHAIQKTLLENLNIPYVNRGPFESLFFEYNYNRSVIIVEKK